MSITIPEKFEKKIKEDSACLANVLRLIQNTESLFVDRPEFFPDYTIHGIAHVERVLVYADKLIPTKTMKLLSSKDIAFLVAAVLLHDLGMFLSKIGVYRLLASEWKCAKEETLDEWTWEEAWERYLNKVKRYSEEQLLYYFGFETPITVTDLSNDYLSDREKLVIGEFLRENHHRIAHEMILDVVPGKPDQNIFEGTTFSGSDRIAIGILARSHYMEIRKTEAYIEKELSTGYKSPLYYLMVVLRIADYLDAGRDRAPEPRQKLQGIRIPVSVKEWGWNKCVIEEDSYWDEEHICRYVFASPKSTTDYVQVEKWLKNVQYELDMGWSVIAEKYHTQKYFLTIHRIKSNIFEEKVREGYEEQFLLQEARLTANPELLKRLVSPLYGDNPSFGVRELVQNAVDACIERQHLERRAGNCQYRGKVVVSVDTKNMVFVIRDNGVGMDADVLLNYYLSAGASYRTSEAWEEAYTVEHRPDIIRNGRFGVGALAMFLLGNTVTVTTRHMDDKLGYEFTMCLKPETLNVRRVEAERGTVLKIDMNQKTCNRLYGGKKHASEIVNTKWIRWYMFSDPVVEYWFNGERMTITSPYIPSDGRPQKGWFALQNTGFDVYRWGYPTDGFFCNGIRIQNESMHLYTKAEGLPLMEPCVSIVDKEGKLRLDLSRSRVLEYPNRRELIEETYKHFIAQLLMMDWSSEEATMRNITRKLSFDLEKILLSRYPFVCTSKQYTLYQTVFLNASHIKRYLKVNISGEHTEEAMAYLRRLDVKIPVQLNVYPKGVPVERWLDGALRSGTYNLSADHVAHELVRYWVKGDYLKASEEIVLGLPKPEAAADGYFRFDVQKGEGVDYTLEESALAGSNIPLITECRIVSAGQNKPLFYRMLMEYLGDDIWIPYDMVERRQKFSHAFAVLKDYIDRIEEERS